MLLRVEPDAATRPFHERLSAIEQQLAVNERDQAALASRLVELELLGANS